MDLADMLSKVREQITPARLGELQARFEHLRKRRRLTEIEVNEVCMLAPFIYLPHLISNKGKSLSGHFGQYCLDVMR